MNDDWRLEVRCASDAAARELAAVLRAGRFEHGLGDAADARVIVTVDGRVLFLYAATRDQAERAMALLGRLASSLGNGDSDVECELRRWHPLAEEWQDPDAPLPADRESASAEYAERVAQERADAASTGIAAFEVRVSCRSHRDVAALAERLRADGIPNVRRWHFLLIGAADEQTADAIAERVRAALPESATVTVEGTWAQAQQELPATSPFTIWSSILPS